MIGPHSISPQRPKTSIFRGCLILDNTPSIASIILDDADDVMHAGDAGDAGDAVPPSRANFAENVQPENLKI